MVITRGEFRGRGARAIAVAALAAFALTACSHRVNVNSNPTGARIYVDGEFRGLTPTSFVERSGRGKEYEIRLEKEGYRTVTAKEKQGINLVFLGLSIFTCGLGLLWSFTLEDKYDYSLEKE